jgi:UDPglucose 6-dehydrogenase
MRIAVVGLWHLGTVTAACLASVGHQVTGLTQDPDALGQLQNGHAPILEPGLDVLLERMIREGFLTFTPDPNTALGQADLVWIAFDTPVDEQDVADTGFVVAQTEALFDHLGDGTVVVFSSQLPVGTTNRVAAAFRERRPGVTVHFGYVPENLRLGKAIECFLQPDRFVAGCDSPVARERIVQALAPITNRIEHMGVESAEMTKHAINAFLAMCVTFTNELAGICEQVGADAKELERGLKSEYRIGPRAYVSPGAAFAGGTLARDVRFLEQIGRQYGRTLPLLGAILPSNERHKHWTEDKLRQVLGEMGGKRIAVLGLTYKAGTSTLRRSSSVETCRTLDRAGAIIQAYDPGVEAMPEDLAFIRLMPNAEATLAGADALLVQTPWPAFKLLTADQLVALLRTPVVIDPGGWLETLWGAPGLSYYSIGRSRQK